MTETGVHQRAKDGPMGQAACTCGETSPRMGTEARRKEWHRSHRREVREGRLGGRP